MSKQLKVGEVYPVPFRMSSTTITVNCLVLETRSVYGRVEWKMAPVEGDGAYWAREDSILGTGSQVVSEKEQQRSARRREKV